MNQNLFHDLMEDFDTHFTKDGVNGERVARRLAEIATIGLTDEGGSRRIGFSEEEKKAKKLVKSWMEASGLDVREDGAGNVFGRLQGQRNDLPAILCGSHVDTVPNGGHFDGVLGVVSALEVIDSWKEQGYTPLRPYEVVVFSDEEGSRFHSGMTGSHAMLGDIDMETQKGLTDINGLSFEEVINDYGSTVSDFEQAQRNMNEVAHFVEVHIEQGKELEKADLPVGIVSGIAGPVCLEMTFYGEAGHAGNTPMTERKDPLFAASELIQKVHALPSQVSDTAVATVGKMHVSPNGVNVIPGEVTLYVDIRDIVVESRDQLVDLIREQARSIVQNSGVELDIHNNLDVAPVPIKEVNQSLLKKSISNQGIEPMVMPSGAGHDAMPVGHHVPVSMLFVRSKDGISHNPKEWSSLNDCVQGIHVLKDYVERLMDE
ncbi:M20 family metallo-hydrolase [Pontibacillus marinus]|uniref:N-carbamoyl-L-amino acid amidohydrolase n=1 Tax=Pontibacillus marinus BH030004 = DSM 16465 TaxID=1385511 RepID=A0A0A5HID6_9BACI|nr:M20 family metallo-hydrolase [Pontibacillus marinus]KGX83402.1 N-carbamoyl-L-amino acid amidohydrolase [Pontibacillus marinus BH030004 = DSM 16465]